MKKRKGNSHSFNISQSKWNLINTADPLEKSTKTISQLSYNGDQKNST